MPKTEDLKEIFEQIFKAYKLSGSLGQVIPRYKRKAPWVIFSEPEEDPGILGKDATYARQYLEWIKTQRTAATAKALLHSFLFYYPKQFPTFEMWRDGIFSVINKSKNAQLALVYEKCKRFYLLADNGPKEFSKLLANSDEVPANVLSAAGLTGQLEVQGFMIDAYVSLLKHLYEKLMTGKQQTKILNNVIKLSVEQKYGRYELRYKSLIKHMADAMLLPFAEARAFPQHKNTIENLFLKCLGDPRIVKTGWIQVSEKSKQVMMSWLVKQTLELFFKILDESADNIWEYRKAFWGAYYKRGYINNAWAILGKDATYIAQRIGDKNLAYGQLSGAYTRNQSVLLLKIGPFVVAEWSHNGKCRIWRDTDDRYNKIPRFYEATIPYDANALRTWADFDQVHHASSHGTWQSKIETYIRRQTNIRIHQSEYMP